MRNGHRAPRSVVWVSSPDLQQLAPSLFRLRIPGVRAHLLNCYLWLAPDGVTLIDTGWSDSAELIEQALHQLGRSRTDIVRIVLTHFHEDHVGAAAEIAAWSRAEVIAGEPDSPFITGERGGPVPVLTAGEQALHPGFTEPPHGPVCRVDHAVKDGEVLDFAGGAHVVAVPGHTPGSIALYLPAADAVLTGDAVAEFNGQVILGVFNSDRQAAAKSLSRLAATGAEIGGFGHGEAILEKAGERIATAIDAFGE